jgi:hypothetical protein
MTPHGPQQGRIPLRDHKRLGGEVQNNFLKRKKDFGLWAFHGDDSAMWLTFRTGELGK